MTDRLPVIDPAEIESPVETPAVAGILLAAGTSSRYGSANKLLATIDGTPVVRQAATTLLDSAADPVIVVTGHEHTRLREVLADLSVTFVHNPDFETGQGASVRVGIDSLPDSVGAAVIALGDMPYIDVTSIDTLVETFAAGGGTALAAGFRGERGNPVLFARTHFNELRAVSGDTGGRRILLDPSTDAAVVETGDPGVRQDVNVPADLGR